MDSRFPPRIHRIWLGPGSLPEPTGPWLDSAAAGFPGWSVRWWRDENLDEILNNAICGHLLIRPDLGVGLRADILRYEVLRQFGGVYADVDFEFFRPLDTIMVEDCLHAGFERGGLVCNALIASPPGFGFWEFFLRRIRAAVTRPPMHDREVLWWTGPQAFTEALRMWVNDRWISREILDADGTGVGHLIDHADVVVWNRETVYPYGYWEHDWRTFRRDDYPQAYAAHHWLASWMKETQPTPGAVSAGG